MTEKYNNPHSNHSSTQAGCCGCNQPTHEHEHNRVHIHEDKDCHAHEDKHGHTHNHDDVKHDHEHAHNQQHVQTNDCGCCSQPLLSPKSSAIHKQPIPQGSQLSAWRIQAMDCAVEEALIRKQLTNMDGISAMEFNLMQRTLTAIHSENLGEKIVAAVAAVGMEAVPTTQEAPSAHEQAQKQRKAWAFAIAGLGLALVAEFVELLNGSEIMGAGFAVAAILLCGLGTYRKGLIALKHFELNINALMSIAVTGAVLIQKWPEAAMVMALFNISELLEARSLDKARQAINSLLQLAPETITLVKADGSLHQASPQDAQIGDIIQVKPGERIALDGIIIKGQTSVNQSALTGESLPVDKVIGDEVFAGTLNASGEFQFRITALTQDSTLARIIHAVEQAQSERAPTQRFVDQFSRYYTPLVVLIAIAIAVVPPLFFSLPWLEWIYKALIILVIACPCALVISTPVTIVSALTAASKRGLLVKGGVYLENGRHLKWLALDKTGTITHGKPVQTDFLALSKTVDATILRQIAASLASRSDHPVSLAVAQAAQSEKIEPLPVDVFQAILGQGSSGHVSNNRYYLGNQRLAADLGILDASIKKQIDTLEQQGKTVIALSNDKEMLALFAVADTIKSSSQQAIAELHALGVNTLMLTGDNPHSAQTIAKQAGITEARGNLLPEDKQKAIEEKKQAMSTQKQRNGLIGMVGDGINDAPALARADIGFAMGAAGTDTAMETADIAIMDDNLRKIPEFIRLSKRTHNILIQNITMALGIKAVFLILTLMGISTMWMAVFADVGASLLVVFNGMRMLKTANSHE